MMYVSSHFLIHLYSPLTHSFTQVPEQVIKPLTKKDRENKLVGKKFFDEGDYKKKKKFKKGEFVVLARALMKFNGSREVCYWCERQTEGVNVERDVVMFGRYYMTKMINKYEKQSK